METKQVKKFSIAMFLVAFALMIAAVFAVPAIVFAQDAPKSVSDKLTIIVRRTTQLKMEVTSSFLLQTPTQLKQPLQMVQKQKQELKGQQQKHQKCIWLEMLAVIALFIH